MPPAPQTFPPWLAKQPEAKKEKDEQELAKEKEKTETSQKNVDADYRTFLKTNKCEKKNWSRYEFGRYFQELASKNKIAPYDVMWGDAYARRNISSFLLKEINDNFFKYIAYHMPEPISRKFNQEFPTEEEKEKNAKAVFNTSIKRDYGCYKKLK